jgi:hypothetical protein
VRLETIPAHLCEREGWRREYRKLTIKIFDDPAAAASTDCPRATWTEDPAACVAAGLYTTAAMVEDWTVESVGRHFDVSGHAFDETVCVSTTASNFGKNLRIVSSL